MGEEKRKTSSAAEVTENPHKSPRLDAAAAASETLPELSHPPSTEQVEATTGDSSTFNIGSCQHLFRDSEELDDIASGLKDPDNPPSCDHDPCSTTWTGAAGLMVCTECSDTFCIGEKGDREHPRGHAAWHAESDGHWVALWCDEPSKGYCFECKLTLMLGKNKVNNEDDYALVPRNKKEDELGTAVSYSLDDWAARFFTSAKVDSEETVHSNTMDLWRMPASTLNAMDQWRMPASTLNSMDQWRMPASTSNAMDQCEMVAGDDRVIKGMPNLGFTCYMNASLQCLLALGMVRTIVLSPDARLGKIGLHLKQLFVDTSSGNNARHTLLDPKMIYEDMWSLCPTQFMPNVMADSHEFFESLCNALHNEVEQPYNLQEDALFPTFSNSIFTCELLGTVSCKFCSHYEVTHRPSHGIQLAVPSKDRLATIKPLQVDSTERKNTAHDLEEPTKALDFIPKLFDDFGGMEESTEDSHITEDKEKAQSGDNVHNLSEHMNSSASIEDCLTLFSHDLTNCKNCSKVAADLPETNGSQNVEPIMASTNLNTIVDGNQTEQSDRKTSPSERSSGLSSLSVESPSRQQYRSDSHHQVILSEDTTSEEVTSGKRCGKKDLTSCSTADEKAKSHEGVQEPAPSCLTTDEQPDLLSARDIQDTSTQKQGSGKQVNYDHSAQQVAEKQNKQTDGNGRAVQTQLISKLPPVLTILLQRNASALSKSSEHVSFKEILHVGPFMDPSSEDKDNLSYRLVGVIEHIGGDVNIGHYIAYVRASRGQQGSGPSSWVYTSDRIIRRVSLEEVLRREATILFYERIDD